MVLPYFWFLVSCRYSLAIQAYNIFINNLQLTIYHYSLVLYFATQHTDYKSARAGLLPFQGKFCAFSAPSVVKLISFTIHHSPFTIIFLSLVSYGFLMLSSIIFNLQAAPTALEVLWVWLTTNSAASTMR